MSEKRNEVDTCSIALAMNISASVLNIPIEINRALVLETIQKLLTGGQPELPQEEYHEAMRLLQTRLQEKAQEQAGQAAAANLETEKKFLAENAAKEGIQTTPSGLQYEILTPGDGPCPKATDTVKVHYEGHLLNGVIFDSSVKRGEPIEFPLNRVIPGWTEGVQLMNVGSKFRFFIPAALGYGERGAGEQIPPNATLIFEVELLGIQ